MLLLSPLLSASVLSPIFEVPRRRDHTLTRQAPSPNPYLSQTRTVAALNPDRAKCYADCLRFTSIVIS